MCKIFAVTNASKLNITPKLIQTVKDAVCVNDHDGFGYALLNDHGYLGGERTVDVEHFKGLSSSDTDTTSNLPFISKQADRFGDLSKAIKGTKSFMAHGRMSTNTVSLPNTHPFYDGDLSLIHNGVVQDFTGSMKDNLTTDNDSEICFKYWQKGGMGEVEANVSGYYALAVLDAKRKTLHIARDSRATLFIAWSRTIDSYVIATTKDILNTIAKGMKWKLDAPELIADDSYIVFDGNRYTVNARIEPLGYAAYRGMDYGKAAKSLGESYNTYDNDAFSYTDDMPGPTYTELLEEQDRQLAADKELKAVGAKLAASHISVADIKAKWNISKPSGKAQS